MTPSQVIDQIRFLTRTSSTDGTGTEANLLRLINDYYLRQVVDFVNENQDKFGRKAFTTLSVNANQEYYALPVNLIRLKRIEVTYDGSNWKKVNIMDDNDQQTDALDKTDINNDYNQGFPWASIYGDAIYLRPIPATNVSLGLKLWYITSPTLITNISVDTFVTPAQYHGYLAYGPAAEVATRLGNEALHAQMFQKWEDGRKKIKDTFNPYNLDKRTDFKTLPVEYT